MFKCNELIYIQMPKTGCTHIASLLSKIFDGEIVGLHNAATPQQLKSANYFISSIRNPWDWYLSLWTYGVKGCSALMHHLTKRKLYKPSKLIIKNPKEMYYFYFNELTKDVKTWRSVYQRVNDAESFRKWLRLMHEPDNSRYLGEGYGNTAITHSCGFMTYRYLFLCCRDIERLKIPGLLTSFDDLVRFDVESCYINYFIRQEALEDTLCKAIERVRPLTQQETELIFGAARTNTSERVLSIAEYYDRESIDLIRDRDRLLIEKFEYSPPK